MNVLPVNISTGGDALLSAGFARSATDAQQVTQVAEQFESVFMSMLSKQLRESLEDGMFGGENSDTYGAMFDMYLGQHLAQAGGIGIQKMLISRYAEASQTAAPNTNVATRGDEPAETNSVATRAPTSSGELRR